MRGSICLFLYFILFYFFLGGGDFAPLKAFLYDFYIISQPSAKLGPLTFIKPAFWCFPVSGM